jgi:hypothetical protein
VVRSCSSIKLARAHEMTDAPAQHPSKARVFISYSRKDLGFADRLDAQWHKSAF